MDQKDPLLEQAERIRSSQVLGRSQLVNRLFDFLVECALARRVPKEIDIAIDAFGRDARFDPSQDAVVRVCVHKLRRKLDEFYAGPGGQEPVRITIARGEYRLLIESRFVPLPEELLPVEPPMEPVAEEVSESRSPRTVSRRVIMGGLAASALANVALWVARETSTKASERELNGVRSSSIWRSLLDDDLPICIVVGDYYIFGEVDEFLTVKRLVRDFEINSLEDLEWSKEQNPDAGSRYQDLNLDYLPTASAFALGEVVPVLTAANRRLRLVVASELDPATLKSSHIVYLGYLSGLGMLRELVFAGSRFSTGETFDELIDHTTGNQYVTDVGGPVNGQLRYRDYGYFSTFPGPAGNQIIIIAGTRDTAVMQLAEMMTERRRLDELREEVSNTRAIEALYEVYGFENTNLDAKLVLAAHLNATGIWTASR